jgi:hypothetical protein
MNNNNSLYCLPSRFKAELTEDTQNIFETIKNTWNKRSPITLKSIRTKNPLVIHFSGFSKTDNRLLFKVIDGTQTLSEYFKNNYSLEFSVIYNQGTEAQITLSNPTL